MIIGGIKYPNELSSVELYNWKTGEKCETVIYIPHKQYFILKI
jgi:hypothetical protein